MKLTDLPQVVLKPIGNGCVVAVVPPNYSLQVEFNIFNKLDDYELSGPLENGDLLFVPKAPSIEPDVLKALLMPPVQFDAYCSDPANRDKLQRVSDALEGIAIGSARLVAYMRVRGDTDINDDQRHELAVDESNKVVAKLRKAFGYNITQPLNF